ncbi:FHA domain-containing protein [Actinomadura decatromicini]|uniref:FHA domain-containing protein n=1 Tax=Actinomadura decatromicini TaxID=2604572 RepID=A0A5D3FK84_9ACTN|nr:FHA domain-containing protein [Actinomadura decatromicini]TYK48296.1 FHA domain-containing protein [Actinomadura decatromicini]
MPHCPSGHASQATDFCDVCGERIASSAPSTPSGGGATGAQPVPGAPAAGTPCPDCGTPGSDRFCEACGYDFATGGGVPTPRTAPAGSTAQTVLPTPPAPPARPGGPPDRGPSDPRPPTPEPPPVPSPPPPAPASASGTATAWTAVVRADRDYFDAVMAEEGPDSATLAFPPYAPERRIPLAGPQVRIGRRGSAQPTPPEIDLRDPPEDPGISHVHAVLLARPDGTWSLVDPGSTNGTCVNGSTEPIPTNVEVPVSDGDRIHVGAWTTITLIREAP